MSWCPALLLLFSCAQGPDPASPRQALLIVNGVQGTPFEVVEIRAANAVHHPCLAGEPVFAAPYRFVIENAFEDIQGVFRPTTDQRLADAQLLLGGETIPRRIDDPDETTPIHTGASPLSVDTSSGPCTSEVFSGAPEVRVDVQGTPGIRFEATLGDLQGTHIINAQPIPATFFLEDTTSGITGVFSKLDEAGEMTVTLLIDGVERRSGTSPAGASGDVVVHLEF